MSYKKGMEKKRLMAPTWLDIEGPDRSADSTSQALGQLEGSFSGQVMRLQEAQELKKLEKS